MENLEVVKKRIFAQFFVVNYPPGTATSRYIQSIIDKYSDVNTSLDEFHPLHDIALDAKMSAISRLRKMLDDAIDFESRNGIVMSMKDIDVEVLPGVVVDKQSIRDEILESLTDSGISDGMAKELVMLIEQGLIDHVQIVY
jgi:hypothetical protein